MEPKKTISRDTYLKALGLYHLAHQHSEKSNELADALEEILAVPEEDRRSSHFYDEVFRYGLGSLDDALRRANYVVEG